MVMSNLLNDLKNYLASLSKEEFLEVWEKTAEYADIGINVEEFLSCNEYCYKSYEENDNTNKFTKPEVCFGLFQLIC